MDVKTAAAVADLEYPALTTEQKEDATAKALLSFNEKHLQVGKLNERKVIVVSIAVVSEGLVSFHRVQRWEINRERNAAGVVIVDWDGECHQI